MGRKISRRQMLSLALLAGSAGRVLADAPPPKVNEKDSVAVALGYVSDVKHVDQKASPQFKAGSTCSSCSWYQGKAGDPAGGACTFFPGKNVDSNGWCRMYNKKA
ncbi:MAG: high-potential iron-sulfur protein [Proteobacteria bacterium]|nr:high-potential iron-sulfur protein [Pseudomonadota bacterium]